MHFGVWRGARDGRRMGSALSRRASSHAVSKKCSYARIRATSHKLCLFKDLNVGRNVGWGGLEAGAKLGGEGRRRAQRWVGKLCRA
jgi:hypothetical protein